MTNRLPYETIGGAISEADTFAQLLEHLAWLRKPPI
jgi:hypothetical protein